MIIRGNTVGTIMPRTNYNQTDSSKSDYLVGKDELDEAISAAFLAAENAATEAGKALPKAGGTMTGVINMNSKRITGLPTPTQASDAVSKNYMETYITNFVSTNLLGGEW